MFNQRLAGIVFVVLAILSESSWSASPAAFGEAMGVMCSDSNGRVRSLEALDTYEARKLDGLTFRMGTDSSVTIITRATQRLASVKIKTLIETGIQNLKAHLILGTFYPRSYTGANQKPPMSEPCAVIPLSEIAANPIKLSTPGWVFLPINLPKDLVHELESSDDMESENLAIEKINSWGTQNIAASLNLRMSNDILSRNDLVEPVVLLHLVVAQISQERSLNVNSRTIRSIVASMVSEQNPSESVKSWSQSVVGN
jgi:hypothetical protein